LMTECPGSFGNADLMRYTLPAKMLFDIGEIADV
jgi:hypothetical protein